MQCSDEIIKNADRLAEIKKEQDKLKAESDELQGYFLKLSETDLEDTKLKTITYSGSNGNKITATMADSLKLVYPTFLKKVFGEAYNDVVTEEIKYKLSASATRLLTGIWKKDYIKQSFNDILMQLPVDDNARKVLAKKLKGINFDKDKDNLIKIGGLNEEAAEQYAFFVNESVVWENFTKLLNLNNESIDDVKIADALAFIDGAVVVEETPKISVEVA